MDDVRLMQLGYIKTYMTVIQLDNLFVYPDHKYDVVACLQRTCLLHDKPVVQANISYIILPLHGKSWVIHLYHDQSANTYLWKL